MSQKTCFVMMPFSANFQSYYDLIFVPALKNIGLHAIKVDEVYTPTQISNDIFKLIAEADIVLADVTGKNPNVNYELGIAHALGKKTVILTQSSSDVPFDYKHLRYIHYDTQFAGWESKLLSQIETFVSTTLSMNSPTTNITGEELKHLISFLESTALDFSYEISKSSELTSDLDGNCNVKQSWIIKAKSDLTHFIHGVLCDEPGEISLNRIYDKTNGVELKSLVSIGEEKRARYIIFLNKMLKAGESLSFDIEYKADGYLSHLFTKKAITMFQRPNTQRGVYYNFRHDKYVFPANDFTKNLSVKSNDSKADEAFFVKEEGDKVIVSVELDWAEPYPGNYSYEIFEDNENN